MDCSFGEPRSSTLLATFKLRFAERSRGKIIIFEVALICFAYY